MFFFLNVRFIKYIIVVLIINDMVEKKSLLIIIKFHKLWYYIIMSKKNFASLKILKKNLTKLLCTKFVIQLTITSLKS